MTDTPSVSPWPSRLRRDYFVSCQPLFLENWPEGLRALSLPVLDLQVTEGEVRALLAATSFFPPSAPSNSLERLERELARALELFPEGAFMRFGSRSLKDSEYARRHGLRTTSSSEGLALLLSCPRNAVHDLRMALSRGYLPHLFLRPWADIPAWCELRCFMRSYKMVGISHADCRTQASYPVLHGLAGPIQDSISLFFREFRKHIHVRDVVFDVYIDPTTIADEGFEVKLLDLNPFRFSTAPFLFSWFGGGDFDGTFRYRYSG